jgi:hypothetical protein
MGCHGKVTSQFEQVLQCNCINFFSGIDISTKATPLFDAAVLLARC